MTFEEMKDRMIEHDDFADKHKYSNWSCFQAGRIIQFVRDNNDKDVVEFGISKKIPTCTQHLVIKCLSQIDRDI